VPPARLVGALLTVFLLAGTAALAEPAIALRTGYACSQCHLNHTGGGMRTPFGSLYGQLTLPQRLLRWRDGENLLPADPDARLAIGADARFQALAISSPDTASAFSFEVPEANVYAEGRLIPGHLSVYFDEKLGPGGAGARELFAIAQTKTWDAYIKVGKFMPPYGWRLPDDAAYIRQYTGFTYSAPDVGVEAGIAPGRWSAQLAITNGASGGSEDNRSKQFSLLAQTRFKIWRFGVSASNNIAGGARVTQAGLFGGIALGRLVLLGEADQRRTKENGGTSDRRIAFAEADLQIARGLDLKFTHDWTDPDTRRLHRCARPGFAGRGMGAHPFRTAPALRPALGRSAPARGDPGQAGRAGGSHLLLNGGTPPWVDRSVPWSSPLARVQRKKMLASAAPSERRPRRKA
jgi:hypothetical protein